MLLIILFAVELRWLPAGGTTSVDGGGPLDRLRYLVLPVLTLTLLTAGVFVRFVRAAMLETLREPFVRTARALGCRREPAAPAPCAAPCHAAGRRR